MRLLRWAPVLLLAACGGGGSDSSYNTGPTGGGTPVLTSISLSAAGNLTTVAAGSTVQLSAAPKDATGTAFAATVTWSSGNTAVATVNSSGLVSGVSDGTAVISATSGSVTGTISVFVGTVTFPLVLDIEMPGEQFSPATADIAQGGTVHFNFPSLGHTVVFNPTAGAPADIPLTSGATVNRTFTTKGTFNYQCTIHAGMTAVITVH